jgi:uncharacterized RDD family membrane protein YckC
MHVGLYRRIASYLIDILPIIMLVLAMQSWFVGDMLKTQIDPNYDQLEVEYLEKIDERNALIDPYYTQFQNDEMSEEDFLVIRDEINNEFLEENAELINTVVMDYWLYMVMYWIISINVIYYIYVLYLKGQTFGRKIMKIELQGNIKWYTLLLREIIWKNLFFVISLSAGIAIDIGLIAFTKKKRTLRDLFTQTYLGHEGVQYPF